MPLPVLSASQARTPDDLVRLYLRTELHWTRHLGEEAALDAGVAFTNADLPNVWDANRVLDAAVPAGHSAAAALSEAEAHFAARGVRCAQWTMNAAAPRERTAPLAEILVESGWRPVTADVLRLTGAPAGPPRGAAGLTIVPARASFRHARALSDQAAADRWGEPQLADADMLHLDDPHWDALIALDRGEAVGGAGVLAVGDVGRIDAVYVTPASRRRGVGDALIRRVTETCARSLFRHVMFACDSDNAPAQAFYANLGFRKIGRFVSYLAPWTSARAAG